MADIRKQAMTSLKQYRSGWVVLGEALKTIEEKELFNDWGFAEFKDYCKQELGITPATAKQMIKAYDYIKANEPNLLAALGKDEIVFIPDYCSVNMLNKAYDKGEEKAVDRLHDKLFSESTGTKEGPEDLKTFMKEMKGGGDDVMDDIKHEAKKVKKLAKKLVDGLNSTSAFPTEIIDDAGALEKKIEAVEV
jgi:hypothetical protein